MNFDDRVYHRCLPSPSIFPSAIYKQDACRALLNYCLAYRGSSFARRNFLAAESSVYEADLIHESTCSIPATILGDERFPFGLGTASREIVWIIEVMINSNTRRYCASDRQVPIPFATCSRDVPPCVLTEILSEFRAIRVYTTRRVRHWLRPFLESINFKQNEVLPNEFISALSLSLSLSALN